MNQTFDVICFSHLRWNFVYQRPQHLLSRCAREHRVIFIEEPVFEESANSLRVYKCDSGVTIVTPVISPNLAKAKQQFVQRALLTNFLNGQAISNHVSWYYTPMALNWLVKDDAKVIVYDCMDELSAFKGAPAELQEMESRLLRKADLVFTGGISLYEYKRHRHPNIHPFPSSVDVPHFAQARAISPDLCEDQKHIAHPRLGFFGVVDERFDVELLGAVADLRPDMNFVIVGPVVKIDPATLPRRRNIHYLGPKSYAELPAYLAGWDAAIMPFAKNESTRFISPTKTPEYLAAGRPVVSTSITDVVRPYGEEKLVHIADDPRSFAHACAVALQEDKNELIQRVDRFLADRSWDATWKHMSDLVCDVYNEKTELAAWLNAQVEVL